MQENGEEDKGKATPTQIHVDKKGVTCVYMHGVGFRERGGEGDEPTAPVSNPPLHWRAKPVTHRFARQETQA